MEGGRRKGVKADRKGIERASESCISDSSSRTACMYVCMHVRVCSR
jgi:hypothetical protein